MKLFDIILTGIALSMDAFALTVANCTTYKDDLNKKKEWSMPIAFSLFQFLMPVIGFYIGSLFADKLSSFAGFITFGVFFILSMKIVFDNVREIKGKVGKEKNNTDIKSPKFSFLILILQAIATSIDALIIGAGSFAFTLSSPFLASVIVGAITFLIVMLALIIGKNLGNLFGKYASWAGAVILFSLSIKNLIQAII